MTLLLLFPQKAAAWSELLVKGSLSGNDNWTTIATLTKQDANGNSYSGTIDASSWTSGAQLSFKLYDNTDDGGNKWWGNSGTADMTNNSSVTLSNANTSGSNMTLMHNPAYSSYTLNCSYSEAGWTIIITGVESSTGGGSSTSGDESADNSDTESTTAGYGVPDNFGGVILRYNSSTEPTKGNLYDWKDYFSVAYLTPDSKGFKSNFAPYFNYLIKDVASHAEVENGWDGYVVSMSQSTHPLSISAYGNPDFLIGNWSNSTLWTVGTERNYTKPYLDKIDASYAGMLDFPLRTFIYNIEKGSYADASSKGWQALTNLTQIAPNNNYRSSVIGSGRNSDALYNRLGVTFVNNDKVNNITGVENIKKAYAVILTSPGTPVVNYSDLANSNLSNDILRLIKIRQWAGIKNTSEFQNKESREKNHAYVYHIQGDFAELKVVIGDEAYLANYEKGGDGDQTTGGTKDRNSTEWGGESYSYTLLDEGTGWRVWYKNNNNANAIHVAISPEGGLKKDTVNCTGQVIGIPGSGERKFAYTTDGTAPVLGASNTKEVTYKWNSTTQSGKIDDFSSTHPTVSANGGYVTVIARAIKDGALVGALDTVTYRFTDYVPLAVKLTPPTATVPYGTSLTPKAEVINTTDATRRFAFTIDGTNPVINTKDASAGNPSTWVVTYTYDPVIPTSDLGTFYMTPGNVLAFIDNEGKTTTLTGTSVTVKAQAVQTVTSDGTTTYRLEGNIATGNYTFETAGVQPGTSYSLTVTNEEQISVNKATATVTVTNNTTTKDDGVDVYYTTDKTDPATSPTARLVRNRKITVYALPATAGTEGTIKVAIPNTETKASCEYDITYSTSEGGYQNYLVTGDTKQKTLGGKGHVVVYVQPTNESNTTSTRQTYIYAYEKLAKDSYASLTHAHRLLTDADKTTVNGETWYYVDLEPADDYKEVNVQLGYKDGSTYKTTDATVANAFKDMFLKFDVATGQIKDVTHAYTDDHFYTIGTNGTKSEAANPASNSPFFYAQVPFTWTSNGNSVKVFKGDAELDGATVDVQNGAEISELSSVCKVYVPASLAEQTTLTIKPYNETTASSISFDIVYQNGGYYYYESAKHNSTTAPLVFSADDDNDKDLRSYGRHDINHVTTGDKTHYLSSDWKYSTETGSKTTPIEDNWTGSKATVNVIPAGTTIKQEVSGLTAGTPYTVQMIVRGKSGATGKLSLNDATEGTATDSKSFTGYDAAGTITTDGRVEALLSGTSNGWQKLEATANASAEGKLTISLAAAGNEMELSDVTLLEKANTKGYVWTKAPTSNDVTEYDLSDRTIANAFSFFDRGDNKNAIVYANANTVLGMSENTYDVAVSNGDSYTMNTFALTDQAQDGTKNTDGSGSNSFWANAWKYNVKKSFTANSFAFDRHFTQNKRSTICVPVALSESEIKSLFGTETKVYDLKTVDVSKYEINATEVTAMEANHPYIIFVPANYDMRSVSGSFAVSATGSTDPCKTLEGGYTFYSNYEQKTIYYGDKEKCYNFGDAEGGRFYRVNSRAQGVPAKPFRGYIKADSPTPSAKMFTLRIVDKTMTGVASITTTEEMSDGPVYTLTGVRVAEKLSSSLAPGIYIHNGKKMIVK